MHESKSDATLVASAATGDEQAFRLLYRAHVRPVYWIAHGILGNATDAEDVTQETFVTAWRKLPGFTLAGESLLPWLATICRFHAANRLRRSIRQRQNTADSVDDLVASTINVEQQVIGQDLADRIVAAVQTLSEIDQRIFALVACEGYAYQSAADELGLTHGAVRNRLSRLRAHVRTSIEDDAPATVPVALKGGQEK